MGERLVAARDLHQHGVHAPTVLQVQVTADDGALGSLEADGAAEGDVLLQDRRRGPRSGRRTGRAPPRPSSASSLAISSTRETNSGDFATKSVSHSSIGDRPRRGLWSPWTTTATAPWERSRVCRLAALMMPFSRSRRSASAMLPPAFSSARRKSSMPAPVLSPKLLHLSCADRCHLVQSLRYVLIGFALIGFALA